MSARELRPAALAVAPSLAGIVAGVAGILLLASGATPSEPTRFAILMAVAPSILIELSHFLSSILGLVLLLLAFGLRSRLDAAWWAHHSGGEKAFSMGGFEPRYVAEFPIAVVRVAGRIVAFATLWPTAHKAAFSMDLMRYADDAPKNVMDYLFVELLQWGRDEGYGAFEFGMAPLAGLNDRPLAPIMSRVGRLLYERGEDIYNFQGVRRYKDKYDPVWQPRYIAAPHKWSIPFLLADIGLLSSGGVSGLTKRPRPSSAGRRSASPAGSAGGPPEAG